MTTHIRTQALWLCGISYLAFLPTQSAQAQQSAPLPAAVPQSAPVADQSGPAVADIIVTAQKRSERLQDVPIAITAIGGAKLQATGIQDAADLAQAVPGLSFNTQLGNLAQPRIRGVGTAGSGPGLENPVALYIDGVYYGAQSGGLLNLSNVEQVAVLKGPQGTLFGRNATGGLLQVTTKDPSHDLTGDFSGSFGTYKALGVDAYLSGGLSNTLAASGTFHLDNQYDGFGHNVVSGQQVDKHNSLAAQGKLQYKEGATKITLSGAYSQFSGPAFAPNLVDNFAAPPGFGPFDSYDSVPAYSRTRLFSTSLTAEHDFAAVTAKSITAYNNSKFYTQIDADETPFNGTEITFATREKEFSQELQLVSNAKGRLTWATGLYYYRSVSGYNPENVIVFPASLVSGFYSTGVLNSYAAFGQATYRLTDTTNLTAGLRYTIDQRAFGAIDVITSPFFNGTTSGSATHTFKQPTWRAALDHHFSPDVLGYLSYDRGFKSGLYEPTSLPLDLLKPETLDAYEAGLKMKLFDRKLVLNVAVYYNDYKNVQVVQIVNAREIVFNGDGSKTYGADFDATLRATDNLTLTAGASALHGRYGAFPSAFLSQPIPGGGNDITVGPLPSGQKLQNTPDYTISLGGSYAIPSAIGKFTLNADYYYNAGYFADPQNRLAQPGYSLVNASINWASPDQKYYVRLIGKNLTNTIYAAQLSATAPGDQRQPADPRTVMGTIGVRF
jgi:iron complex outermembrane receptor protein